jgi:hypothetical protein
MRNSAVRAAYREEHGIRAGCRKKFSVRIRINLLSRQWERLVEIQQIQIDLMSEISRIREKAQSNYDLRRKS